MLQNNLKIAWRHLLKNKFISAINLTGLIVGMTAALFIWQYVNYERSYDQMHLNGEQVFRVRTDRVKDGVPFMQFAAGAACAGPLIKNNFAEVEDYVKFKSSSEAVYTYGTDVSFREDKVYYTMPSVFDIFSFPLIKGNKETALAEPFTACISESTAKKIFGGEDPVGKSIFRNGNREYKITGVFADCPPNSHLKFNILLSYITFSDVFNENNQTETAIYWDGYLTYLKLKPNTDWKNLETKIPAIIEKNYDQEAAASVEFYLQPLQDIHLNSNYLFEAEVNGDEKAVNFLFIIGILVLLIAWFNYINMSTARSEIRAKEVGVRKVVGSSRGKLIGQFLTEAAVMNLFAIIGSFAMVQLLNPFFEKLIDKEIPITLLDQPKVLFSILAVFIIGTILAGLYPAFLLSSFKPIAVLKSNVSNNKLAGGNWLRRGLVVVQFMATVGLIAGTIIIYKQLQFMQETKLGLSIDQTLVVKGPNMIDSTFSDKSKIFIEEVEQLAPVKLMAGSSSVPGQAFGWTIGGVRRPGWSEEKSEAFHGLAVDPDYSVLYEMELAAGRHMSDEMGTDNRIACLLNETGAKLLEFETPEEAVGKGISYWGDQFIVAGVLKDFHQESPKAVVEPMIMRSMPGEWGRDFYSVKLNTKDLSTTITQINQKWSSLFPGNPFDYFFLDDHFNQQYAADQRFGKIFLLFSGLSILVACLGLFALVAFVAERKKKEIGIRKVLGATVPSLVTLLSKDFIKLVVVALIIASPLAYYFMNSWLDNFANRIDIHWWIFALAGTLAIGIAFLTIGFQSVKAALANPVQSLRSE
ncbi:MAG: ABC transporter permease [Bacteroidota bacterium]